MVTNTNVQVMCNIKVVQLDRSSMYVQNKSDNGGRSLEQSVS